LVFWHAIYVGGGEGHVLTYVLDLFYESGPPVPQLDPRYLGKKEFFFVVWILQLDDRISMIGSKRGGRVRARTSGFSRPGEIKAELASYGELGIDLSGLRVHGNKNKKLTRSS
jgi:hypothetical protein